VKPADLRTALQQVKSELAPPMRDRGDKLSGLADALGVSQANISRIEHQDDVYLSTLRAYIEALGGELEITARFPDGEVIRVG